MDVRIEMRKKDFKKTFDDPRRRREEQLVQIRKQNREARLTKKRQQAFEGLDGAPASTALTAAELEKLPQMVVGVMSNDVEQQFLCSQQFRKILSIEKQPPIQEVIELGVVPRFVEFLKDGSRQELQFEAAWALTNIASGSRDQTCVVIEHGAVPVFVTLLSSPKDEVREQAVWALGNIAGDCAEFRDLVLNAGGLQPLLEQLRLSLPTPSKVTMLRNATWTLSNLCRGKPRPAFESVAPAISLIRDLIYSTDSEVLTDACWALSYISDGNDQSAPDAIDAVISAGVCARLVQLLGHSSFAVQTPALRTVGNIVSGNESQTQTMISCGCVQSMRTLLLSPRRMIRKEACWTISNITAGNREQIQEVIRYGLVPLVVDTINTGDEEIKREGSWALANAVSGANPQQIQYLLECKVAQPLCDMLDIRDEKLVGVVLEAIEAILKAGLDIAESSETNVNPYSVLIEEAQGYPKLEKLQYASADSKVYTLAMRIMTCYLAYDEEDSPSNNFETFTTPASQQPFSFQDTQ